jgi:hypothetical protein
VEMSSRQFVAGCKYGSKKSYLLTIPAERQRAIHSLDQL